MVDIRTPFDDDSHTLHDGPLPRFFRMRKWFFATGVTLLLLDTGWWDYHGTVEALALGRLPKPILHFSLTLAGIYLCCQAALVTAQIAFTYQETLRARRRLMNADTQAAFAALERELINQLKDEGADFPQLEDFVKYSTRAITPNYPGGRPNLERHRRLFLRAEAMRKQQRDLLNQPGSEVVINLEIALDIMRIAPTLLLLLYAVVAHGTIAWPLN